MILGGPSAAVKPSPAGHALLLPGGRRGLTRTTDLTFGAVVDIYVLMGNRRSRNRRKPASGSPRQPAPKRKAPTESAPPPQEQVEQAARAKARSDLYEILSLLFQEAPSPELLAVFKHSDFLQIVKLLLSPESLACWTRFASGKMPLNHLQARFRLEYNNLFLVPTSQRVVARESAFFHEPGQPQAAQKRVEDVQKYYRRIGMNPLAKFKEEPDHLSQMMHFMSVLCDRERDYLGKKNRPQLESNCQIQADFVAKHLAPWIPRIRERMHRATRFPFFRNVADLMEEFVLREAEWTADLHQKYGIEKPQEGPAKSEPPKKASPRKPQAKKPSPRGGEARGGEEGARRPRRRRRGGRRRNPKQSAAPKPA